MSFFNSLQQYVTSGVAGLGLSPRRFSLSRQESTEPLPLPPVTTTQMERRESNNSQHHGKFAKTSNATEIVNRQAHLFLQQYNT